MASLVSYFSDSDDERVKEDEEEEKMEEGVTEEADLKEKEEEEKKQEKAEDKIEVFEMESIPSVKSTSSLVSYGLQEEEKPKKKLSGLVSYDGADEEDGNKADESAEADQDESWADNKSSPEEDIGDSLKLRNMKHADATSFSASMSLPESALSQKIRRLSAEEVTLPPEPPGRCPRHLQEKINNYYKKNLNLNQIIQRRKDFRNPSIYEKLINYLGIDELGTNYPKDMYDPFCWDESSYYDALAKTQRDEIQKKKEKEKKEKTKVEFVVGMARKPQVQQAQVTSTTGASATAASSGTQEKGKEEEKKRKSKWDTPGPQNLPPPVPLMSIPRPIIPLVTTTITAPNVISTATSATGVKTTVISSIGTIKKPKIEK